MDQVYLSKQFKVLLQDEKDRYELIAGMNLEQARGLEDEFKELMMKKKGKVSYICLSCQLGEIVCALDGGG